MRSERGFTLMELLTVAAIIVIMTGIMLPNWRAGEKSLALERSGRQVAQDLRRALDLALRAEVFTCADGQITAYGVYFTTSTPDSYSIFANCGDPDPATSMQWDSGVGWTDEVIETRELESRIVIDQLQGGTSSTLSVVFVPPDPTTFIVPNAPGTIRLRIEGENSFRTVTVSEYGVIEVQ